MDRRIFDGVTVVCQSMFVLQHPCVSVADGYVKDIVEQTLANYDAFLPSPSRTFAASAILQFNRPQMTSVISKAVGCGYFLRLHSQLQCVTAIS